MSDNHTGLSHDLPVVRARVYKEGASWRWEHACAYRSRSLKYSFPWSTHAEAFAGAVKHMGDCW